MNSSLIQITKRLSCISLMVLGITVSSYAAEKADALQQDGPLTVCSDQLNYNPTASEVTYSGNVIAVQTLNATILCDNDAFGVDKKPNATVYSFAASNAVSDYDQKQKLAVAEAKKLCKAQQGCKFLAGEELVIKIDRESNKIISVVISADKGHRASYYSFPYPDDKHTNGSRKQDNEPTEAYAQFMSYDIPQNTLTLNENAFIDRGGNTFSGKKVTYNTQTQEVNVPSSGQRATVVLDNLPANTSSQ